MLSRRQFIVLTTGAAAGTAAVAIVPSTVRASDRSVTTRTLPTGASGSAAPPIDPTAIAKYVDALPVPGTMPKTAVLDDGIDYYEIAMRQLRQQVMSTGSPATTLWGYGSVNHQGTFSAPSATIEATAGAPVRVKWINGLVDSLGRYRPHLLPVDPTLHWANPAGPVDSRPVYTSTPGPYTGPVPMVTHVHGAHTTPDSDGYAEAWWLPDARNISGYVPHGSRYDQYDRSNRQRGSAVFQYPNTQRAGANWYHDHSMGLTRLNVYAGPAGCWMIRGGADDLAPGVLPSGRHEIPLVIQDRSFRTDGSLYYPDTRQLFDGWAGPYLPASNGIPPMWQPEFFANTLIVNGKTWPKLDVERRRYRFRLLNACGSRFIRLKISATDPATLDPATASATPQSPALSMAVIGSDGGFLPTVSSEESLLMAPAERYDVIIDFSSVPVGTELYLVNEGPDEPYGGGEAGEAYAIADAQTTRGVLKIVVGPASGPDGTVPVSALSLPNRAPLPAITSSRRVSLNEIAYTETDASGNTTFDGPISGQLGTIDPVTRMPMPMMWSMPVTETPLLGSTEDWEICNFTEDAHPIHLHLVEFEIVGRAPMDVSGSEGMSLVCSIPQAGPTYSPPAAIEAGAKDTVIAYPGQITKVRARFDKAGRYTWHCHIVEHEDNEMMRPMHVSVSPALALGQLAESVLVAFGGGTVEINDSVIDGLISTGPGRVPAFGGANTVDALRTHQRTSVRRSNSTRVINGITTADQSWLADAAADASRSCTAAKADKVVKLDSIDRTTTVPASGLTVVQVGEIDLEGRSSTLTLIGGPADQFVINVARDVSLSRGAAVRLQGILPSQVVFNLTGRRRTVSLTGGSTLLGTVLNVRGSVRASQATVTGAVIAGGEVSVSDVAVRPV